MRTEDLISRLSDVSRKNNYQFEFLRSCIPLGIDENENIITGHKTDVMGRNNRICVTGNFRTEFICRTLITLSCIYDRDEVCFLILSPKLEYGVLMHTLNGDFTIPYIRNMDDYEEGLETARELVRMRMGGGHYPKLFVVIDGVEDLDGTGKDNMLRACQNCFDIVGSVNGEVIVGADLLNSIFSGYPGAFVGIGNCLITPKGEGKSDITYVNNDSTLTVPKEFSYPSTPTLDQTISFLNSLSE